MTNEKTSNKINEATLFICPLCHVKYNEYENVPKLLPCGKTICDSCIEKKLERKFKDMSKKDNCYYFECNFCSNDHQLTRKGFPLNEILVILLNNNENGVGKDVKEDNKSAAFRLNKSEKFRKVSQLLDEVEKSSNDLETSIKSAKEKLVEHFELIEIEINQHTEKLIDELKMSRDNLIKEVEMHKQAAMSFLSEGLNDKSTIQNFKNECKRNHAKLIEISKANDKASEKDLTEINLLADELNDKIIKTKIYFENCIKSDLKLMRSKTKIEPGTIGKLEFKNSKFLDSSSLTNVAVHDLQRIKTVNYKVPLNTKCVLSSVLTNKIIVKAIEQSIIDDFSYTVHFKFINSDGVVIKKQVEEIGTYRLKKLQTSTYNNYIAVILSNKFLDNYNCLKLFDSQLKLISSIELHYLPVDIFMNKNGIYIKSNNYNLNINKYDYTLKHLKSFGQCLNTNESYFIPNSLRLTYIQDDKLYFVDYDKSKIRIFNESTGKYIKALTVDQGRHFLMQVDTNQRIIILNKSLAKLVIFNWENKLLYEKKIDFKIDSYDQFFALDDATYVIIDKKNHMVYYF